MEKAKIKFNWPLVGNGHIFEFLTKSIINNKIASSYIFYGPDNLGKTTIANYFARSLVCLDKDRLTLPCGTCLNCQQSKKGIHGDIHLISKEKDKKNISIEQVRDFIRTLGLSSFLNSYKIGIIKHAENLSQEAVNALLKTLEEPNLKVVIILITLDSEALPATIISRSQVLKFNQVKTDIIYDYLIKNYKATRSAAKNFSRLALGRPALAVKFLENSDFYENYKKSVEVFIKVMDNDINIRLAAIEDLMGKDSRGQEGVRLASRTVEVWQGLVRDLLFINLAEEDLIQHHVFFEKINALKNKIPVKGWLDFALVLKQAREYIKANVNPKLVLENIAINV